MRLLRCTVLALALAAGCGRAPSSAPARATPRPASAAVLPAAPRWSPADLDRLRRRLGDALGASALATSGIAIVDGTGRPLFVRRERTPFAPASTFKVLVAITALQTLGPDYRFETRLESLDAPGSPTISNLYLVGSGDPSLRWNDLEAGVGVIARSGTREVTGDVVADASAFSGPEINPGWDPTDLEYGFAAGVSAVSLDEGTVELHVRPTEIGAPAQIVVRPPSDAVRVEGAVMTGYASAYDAERTPGRNAFTFSGRVAAGGEQILYRPVVAQAEYAAAVTRTMLRRRGIAVTGTARAGVSPPASVVLWRHRSAPLVALLRWMLFESDNHYAEQLLRAVGASAGAIGTAETGAAFERVAFQRLGAPAAGLKIVDGSGLAASDRIPPISLATLLAREALDPTGDAFFETLPRVGIEGTVRRRDVTTALGRARAKSGHIENVNALAGYVQTQRHGRVAFAVLVNDRRADDGPVDTGIDRALDILAGS